MKLHPKQHLDLYPMLKRDVMLYENKRKTSFLVNPYAVHRKISPVSSEDIRVLKAMTGKQTLASLCRHLKISQRTMLRWLKKWSSPQKDMIDFLEEPSPKMRERREKENRYRKMANLMVREALSLQGAKEDNREIKRYHQSRIHHPMKQFEEVETTVSHIYREPHILLGGKNYGASFVRALGRKGALREGMHVLEIGGGIGFFGKGVLDEIRAKHPAHYQTIQYTLFELSPALLRSQKKLLQTHQSHTYFLEGDIEAYSFDRLQYDLILSNEMVADLVTVKLQKKDLDRPSGLSPLKQKAIDLIRTFRLDVSGAPETFVFNLKALELLQTFKRILRPGGKAYIVEYGSRYAFPRAEHLKDHTEYSIHFGFMTEVAKKLNLHPRLVKLSDFLSFRKNVPVITNTSFFYLNTYLFPRLGYPKLPRAVYTEEMLREKMKTIYPKLHFVGLSRIGVGDVLLDPEGFQVLELSVKA